MTPAETMAAPANISFAELQSLLRRVAAIDQYLTVGEAAEYLRCRRAAIYEKIKTGFPAFTPTPGKILLRKRDLDALVKAHPYDPLAAVHGRKAEMAE